MFNSGFGVGNVADIYLVLGVFLICAYIVFDYKEGDLGIWKSKKVEATPNGENIQSDKVENEAKQDVEEDKEEGAEQDNKDL
ncbi:MAG: hypothetical protein K2O86_03230 [Clostridia bacterium]|nr:hypothetical protein [Clostridia bacterium]